MSNWWDGMRQAYGVTSAYQAGFSQTLPAGLTADLNVMSVGVETGQARPWTVSLNRLRYSAGVLTGTAPPDSEVGAVEGVPPAQPALSPGYIAARIVWGTAGVTESALVDWHQAGSTLQLSASFVRVGLLVPLALQGTATFSGSISPSSRSFPYATKPTRTLPPVALEPSPGPFNSFLFPVADRAVAYRVFSRLTPQPASGVLRLQQTDATNASVAFDAWLGPMSPVDAAAWYPLMPNVQFVNVTNTAAGGQQIGVQFLLDIG